MEKNLVGYVGVDAGILMIGDPCYTLPDDGSQRNETARRWSSFCDRLFADGPHQLGENTGDVVAPFDWDEAGIVVGLASDGSYPVYVERSSSGSVKRIIIECE